MPSPRPFAFPSSARRPLVALGGLALTAAVSSMMNPLLAEDDFTSWFTFQPRSYNYVDASYLTSAEADVGDSDQQLTWSQAKIRALATVYHNNTSDLALWGGLLEQSLTAILFCPTMVPSYLTKSVIYASVAPIVMWVMLGWPEPALFSKQR